MRRLVAVTELQSKVAMAVMLDAANTHFVNFAGTGTGHRIIGNELIGDWGTMAIGGAGVVTNAVIRDNVISNVGQ